jgi:radical SAM protein with 4Fe4S-binding SPASM domain
VSITGGEPLVRSDFWEIVDELKRNQILISVIYSNGKLVTREFLEQLEKRGMHPELNMSFDGVGCHDWLRGVPGAEETAIEAFRLCREMGFSTSAEFCLHRGNRDSLRETVKLLGSLGVRGLKVGPVVEVGEWADFGAGMTLTQEEVYDTYLSYLPQFIEDGQPLLLQLSELFCSMPGGYWIPGCKGVSESQVGNYCLCGHARTELYITAEGRWMPCMPMSGKDELAKQFPGIKDTPLKDALNDSFYLSCIAKNLGEYFAHNPECAACPYRLDCASGCRGRAATEDDYMAVDREICIMYKGGYMERVKKLMEELQIPMVYPQ